LQSISKDHSRTSLGIKQNNPDPSFDLKQHSKNTSISSLNQSRSVLSLSNPFKKALERSVKDTYQPILSNCQLILSRKLTHKELEINDLESRPSSNILKEKNQDMNMTISKKKNATSVYQGFNKSVENDIWSKNKSVAITPFKKSGPTALNSKGKICLSQR
jgi:arginyl-tRNA--protein-N-Asp/Glu arginylyltransferase